jgi:hypothetical protein
MVPPARALLLGALLGGCRVAAEPYARSWSNNSCAPAIGRDAEQAVVTAFADLDALFADVVHRGHACEGWGRPVHALTRGRTVQLCDGWDATPVLAARVLWHELVHVRQHRDQDAPERGDAARWAHEVQAARQELLVRQAIGDGDELGWRDQAGSFAETVFEQYDLDLDPSIYGPLTEDLMLEAIDPDPTCDG